MNFQKLLLTSILGISISTHSLAAQSYTDQEVKQIAINAIKTVGGKLKHTLGQKVKEGGLESAANFCALEATKLAKEASKSLPKGVTIKRITNKPRNVLSQATIEQLKVLNQLETKMKNGKLPKLFVKKISDNHFQVYKPLTVSKKCLNCHGDNNTRNKNAYKVITENYPQDKAINYKLGDLRGAFLVNIIK